VEVALRYNGEVVNAYAMQLYKGLPIITNKISLAEQRGVPHHLLGQIGLSEPTWNVTRFKREATEVIKEIRSRGKLPIVVGGTHYYVNGLLFRDNLVEAAETDDKEHDMDGHGGVELSDEQQAILNGPSEAMHAKLREVDQAMAEKWHPNDSRKIRRSLEIYFNTGKRASDIYAEQERRKSAAETTAITGAEPDSPWQALLFWVYTNRDTLNERLNDRVHKMVDAGLIDETSQMLHHLQEEQAAGRTVDRTNGIWQSIGLKELEPYLAAPDDPEGPLAGVEKMQKSAIEVVQTATRQYAKSQQRWITFKLLPALGREAALDHLFLLDSSDLAAWQENVVEKASSITASFLSGAERPQPTEVSETAKTVLRQAIGASERTVTTCQNTCEVCSKTFVTEESWNVHLRSRTHQRVVRATKRRALVPAASRAVEAVSMPPT
jgi:tRNA dimethylallyltransferase